MAKPTANRKPDDKPTASAFGQMVSRLAQNGITGPELAEIISQSKTRRENARALAAWLKGRPKKK